MVGISKNKYILYIIALAVLFVIPTYIITANTDTLKDGTEYNFKVEAYDPYDMFRGNYIVINFKENEVAGYYNPDSNGYEKDEYYVTISKDYEGFAYFSSASKVKPNTNNYYKATGSYYNNIGFNGEEGKLRIDTPTRYYMNEKKSYNAELVYNQNIENTYVKVRVKDGKMVIVGVYVNDILIDSIDNELID